MFCTQVAHEEALDAEVLILLGVLEGDSNSAAHVVMVSEHWQLDLFALTQPHLVVWLIVLEVEGDIHLHSPCESPEKRCQLLLNAPTLTMPGHNKYQI